MITIIGVRNYSFTSKDGDLIEGVTLYFTEEPFGDDIPAGLNGMIADKANVNKNIYSRLLTQSKKDSLVNLSFSRFSYNKYGKIDGLIL